MENNETKKFEAYSSTLEMAVTEEVNKEAGRLSSKAVLCTLTVGVWFATKIDKEAGKAAEEKFNAKDAGVFIKKLINPDSIKKVYSVGERIRGLHYKNSLPWNDFGQRLLPSTNFETYTHLIRKAIHEWEALVQKEIIDVYEELKKDAQENRLGGLWNPEEYPTIESLKRRFYVKVSFDPVPDVQDFRVKLRDEEVAAIRAEYEERESEASKRSKADLWKRLYGTVDKLMKRMNSDRRPSEKACVGIIDEIKELVELLGIMNFDNDANLEAMIKEVENKLATLNPDLLKDGQYHRNEAANEAKTILNKMSAYLNE